MVYRLSYEYSELIKEVEVDLLEGNLKPGDIIDVIRSKAVIDKNPFTKEIIRYNPIVDYGYVDAKISFSEMEDGDIKEKMVVENMLKELVEMNRII